MVSGPPIGWFKLVLMVVMAVLQEKDWKYPGSLEACVWNWQVISAAFCWPVLVKRPAHIRMRGDKLQGREHGYKEASNQGYQCFQSAIFVYVNFLLLVINSSCIPSFSQSKLEIPWMAGPGLLLLDCDRKAVYVGEEQRSTGGRWLMETREGDILEVDAEKRTWDVYARTHCYMCSMLHCTKRAITPASTWVGISVIFKYPLRDLLPFISAG